MSKWGKNSLGYSKNPGSNNKSALKGGNEKKIDKRDLLLNIGVLLAALSFLTAFAGLRIGSIRIAYKFYQYLYIYVILLASLKYGMSGGLSASLALGVLIISAGHVLPQFKTIQAVPLSPNLQLAFFIGVAVLTAYFTERANQETEDLSSELVNLTKELEKKTREIDDLKNKLNNVQYDSQQGAENNKRRVRPGQTGKGDTGAPEEETPVQDDKPRVIKLRSLLEKKKD
jgi:membrane protein implicated in regulation of membrane protease activity